MQLDVPTQIHFWFKCRRGVTLRIISWIVDRSHRWIVIIPAIHTFVNNWSVRTVHGSPSLPRTLRIASASLQSRSVRASRLAPILMGPNRKNITDRIDKSRFESALPRINRGQNEIEYVVSGTEVGKHASIYTCRTDQLWSNMHQRSGWYGLHMDKHDGPIVQIVTIHSSQWCVQSVTWSVRALNDLIDPMCE